MTLSKFVKKRLSKLQLEEIATSMEKAFKVRGETEKKLFGWPIARLLSHIRFLEAELERVSQEKFDVGPREDVVEITVPQFKTSHEPFIKTPVGGPVRNAFVPEKKFYADPGERAWEAFRSEQDLERLLRWGNIKSKIRLMELANEWADKNGLQRVLSVGASVTKIEER